MKQHAILSASISHRWLACTPSVRLGEKFESKGSFYAREGTEAHKLCENRLKKALGMQVEDIKEDLEFYSEEMEECANSYTSIILEILSDHKDPLIFIEQRLDLSSYVKEGFGTGDCLIVADKRVYVIDYKHGAGILVDAEENPQLMLYGLGALELFDGIYDIEDVIMLIYQPRRDNFSQFKMKSKDLYKWGEEVVKPKSELAFEGKGEYVAGSHCQFCPAKMTCRKRAELALEIARSEFTLPPVLSDEEVEDFIKIFPQIESWIKDVKAYVLEKAMTGHKWQGLKLVEGRRNRKYIDEEEVARVVKENGFNPYEEKLLGITAMTKLLGKERFDELLSDLLEKPKGKPTLVSRDDKREEIIIENVNDEFSKIMEEKNE